MENSYSSYIKQVERALSLPQSQKKELLRGFQAELKEKFPDPFIALQVASVVLKIIFKRLTVS